LAATRWPGNALKVKLDTTDEKEERLERLEARIDQAVDLYDTHTWKEAKELVGEAHAAYLKKTVGKPSVRLKTRISQLSLIWKLIENSKKRGDDDHSKIIKKLQAIAIRQRRR